LKQDLSPRRRKQRKLRQKVRLLERSCFARWSCFGGSSNSIAVTNGAFGADLGVAPIAA
jgi:hypothetical protein